MRLLLSVKDLEQCQPHNKCSKMLATVSIVVILHLHDYLIKVCLCPVSTMNIGQGLPFFLLLFPFCLPRALAHCKYSKHIT